MGDPENPNATTLSTIRARIQSMLNDAGAGTWATATLDKWICDAIRDYSQYFPRTKRTESTLITSSNHELNLPFDFIELVLIEYPDGEDPPAYLKRRSRTHDEFWDYEGYYDLEERDSQEGQGKLFLSEAPTAGSDYYVLTYLGAHDYDLDDDADTLSIPNEHEFLIELYVLWTAFKERVATHLQDPDTTSDILQKMVNAEMQAHEEYRRAIRNAEVHRSQSGWTGPWTADAYDPIY